MKMKKLLAFVMASAMVLSMAACGGSMELLLTLLETGEALS